MHIDWLGIPSELQFPELGNALALIEQSGVPVSFKPAKVKVITFIILKGYFLLNVLSLPSAA